MSTYWWFRPSRIALFVVMPIACCAFLASNFFYQEFGGYNAISSEDFLLIWLSVLGFAGASWLGETVRFGNRHTTLPYVRDTNYRTMLVALAMIAIAATILFLSPFVTRPRFVIEVFSGDPGAAFIARLYANQISGITSLGNLLNLVVVLLMIKPRLTGRRRSAFEMIVLTFIIVLAGFKAVMHGERLALIELLVPLALTSIALRPRSQVWSLAPLVGIGFLFVFFLGTEYLRSWVAYYANRSDSLLTFAFDRMLAYYLTSINNGAFIYGGAHSYFFPVFTGEWLWHMPIPHLRDFLSDITGARIDITAILSRGLNIEFNNTSGIFAPLIDFGPILGVLIWVMLGYLSGRLFRAFREGHYFGLILFPTWYIGFLEMPRIFYWGDNRFFPTLVCSILISSIFLFLLPAPRRDRLRAAVGPRNYAAAGRGRVPIWVRQAW